MLDYFMDIDINKSFQIRRGTAAFPDKLPVFIESTGYYFANKNYFTKRDDTDFYLIIYTISGSGSIVYKNTEYIIKPKDIIFIDCNNYHHYKTSLNGTWEFRWMHFKGSACKDYHNLINEDHLYVGNLSDNSSIPEYFMKIMELFSNINIQSDIRISVLLTKILSEMALMKNESETEPLDLKTSLLIDKVKTYIHSNYKNKIKIDDIIKLVNLSEYHFFRVFKKHTGMSPYDYIIHYRIILSKTYLKDTDLPISEIAYQIGFSDSNAFIRAFKKFEATTPLKYRNYAI